jgi:tetratricopeptide (TPR) repeat protein
MVFSGIGLILLISLLLSGCINPGKNNSTSNEPKTASDWYNRGLYLMATNKNQEAVDTFDKALSLDKTQAWASEAYAGKGYCLMELGKFNESVNAYDQALLLKPTNTIYLHQKALALYSLKKYDDALKLLETVLARDPSNLEVLSDKCDCLEKLGRTGDVKACKEAVDKLLNFKNLDKPLLQK